MFKNLDIRATNTNDTTSNCVANLLDSTNLVNNNQNLTDLQ